MENLENYNLKKAISDMLDDFGGYSDEDAILNIKTRQGIVQFKFMLISSDESNFSDYSEIPTINEDDLVL